LRKRHLFSFFLLVFLLSACGDKLPIESDMNETVDNFTFTTEQNEAISLADLEGQWWIANFIFTNCETVCLPMTSNMSHLQSELQNEELPVQLVSFSVDPDYDTPEVLQEYGKEYEADFTNWSFLTGYSFQEIKEISIKSFRAPLKEPEYGSTQVLHDTRFFLVNPEGKVIKGYDGVQAKEMQVIIDDLQTLRQNDLL